MEYITYTATQIYTELDVKKSTFHDRVTMMEKLVKGFAFHNGKRCFTEKEREVMRYVDRLIRESGNHQIYIKDVCEKARDIFYTDLIASSVIEDLKVIYERSKSVKELLEDDTYYKICDMAIIER